MPNILDFFEIFENRLLDAVTSPLVGTVWKQSMLGLSTARELSIAGIFGDGPAEALPSSEGRGRASKPNENQ